MSPQRGEREGTMEGGWEREKEREREIKENGRKRGKERNVKVTTEVGGQGEHYRKRGNEKERGRKWVYWRASETSGNVKKQKKKVKKEGKGKRVR